MRTITGLHVEDLERRDAPTTFSGPPRIFIDLPAIPTLEATPSVALFNWGTQNLPLIGSISVGVTLVPPAAPAGPGDVSVEYFGQLSNPFPFTKN